MKWCPYCKKYTIQHLNEIEFQSVNLMIVTYHCSSCNGFIESEWIEREKLGNTKKM
ncbi:hypothetical protein ES703_14151 [subsurface metagenome]